MYIIKVHHADGFVFEVKCSSVEHTRLVETELMKRFPAFEGYAVGCVLYRGVNQGGVSMIIRCLLERVPFLCAGLVKQGIQFTCNEEPDGIWLITLTGGY